MIKNKEKLRIGILVDGYSHPKWIYNTIDMINKSNHSEIVLVVNNKSVVTQDLSVFQRIKRVFLNIEHIFYYIYVKFDRLYFGNPEIFNIVKELNEKEGVSVLLAEQNTNVALKNSDHGYIIETGKVMLEGTAKSLLNDDKVKELYLGISKEGRKNFRDVLKKESKKKSKKKVN